MSVVVSKGTVGVKEERPSVRPSQKRFNLPKETRNPYGVLASRRNQFGTGFRDWLTCTVVWVLSWQPQLSTLGQPKKICSILKNMNTHLVTIVPVLRWSKRRKFPLTFTAHEKKQQLVSSYLYSFFNVVFNVPDFLLFLPVKVRRRLRLFHLRRYSNEVFKQTVMQGDWPLYSFYCRKLFESCRPFSKARTFIIYSGSWKAFVYFHL